MLNDKLKRESEFLYLLLGGTFIALLVTCNLIFQKFIFWDFGFYTFEFSAGLLPYPLTFLVTDVVSEIYGARKANNIVKAGLLASIVVMLIILIAENSAATNFSPVDNATFSNVFGLTLPAVFASMVAYLMAQFIDIKVYHFLKRLTKSKHLWVRNNFSTITSQLVDTSLVLVLLCFFGSISWDKFFPLFVSSFLLKLIFAIADTPIFYFIVLTLKKRYNLKPDEELIE